MYDLATALYSCIEFKYLLKNNGQIRFKNLTAKKYLKNLIFEEKNFKK